MLNSQLFTFQKHINRVDWFLILLLWKTENTQSTEQYSSEITKIIVEYNHTTNSVSPHLASFSVCWKIWTTLLLLIKKCNLISPTAHMTPTNTFYNRICIILRIKSWQRTISASCHLLTVRTTIVKRLWKVIPFKVLYSKIIVKLFFLT